MIEEEYHTTGTGRELVKRACDFCRRRKIKCDGNINCLNCQKHSKAVCTYEQPILKRGPKGGRSRAVTMTDQHRPNFSTLNTSTAGLLFNTSSEQSRSSSPNVMKELESLFSFNEIPSPFLKNSELTNLKDSQLSSLNEAFPSPLSKQTPKLNLDNANSTFFTEGTNQSFDVSLPSPFLKDSQLANLEPEVSTPFLRDEFGPHLENKQDHTSEIEQNNDSEEPKFKELDFSQMTKQYRTFHELLPSRQVIHSLHNWPLTEYGIDFVKLVLFLGDLPNDKLSTMQIQSIVGYFQNFHCKVPIIEIEHLFYFLCCNHDNYIKHLLNDFLVLHKLTQKDFAKTDQIVFDCWLNSLNTYYPTDLMNPFSLAIFVLDAAIARLAVLLI